MYTPEYVVYNFVTLYLCHMKNFKNFERAYQGLVSARGEMLSIPIRSINEYSESSFVGKRRNVINGIDEALAELKNWFKKNFPRTRYDAFHSEAFTFKAFFAMLKKYPELAKENKDSLQSLLNDMKGGHFAAMQIDKIPDISEFV